MLATCFGHTLDATCTVIAFDAMMGGFGREQIDAQNRQGKKSKPR